MYYPSGYYRGKARAALKGHWQTALLICLIVSLPSLLTQGIAMYTGNDPMDRMQSLIVQASRDGVLSEALIVNEARTFLQSTGYIVTQSLSALAWLITPFLTLGMYNWMIGRLRGKEEPVTTVFSRAKLFLRAIGLQLMIILEVLLWMLPGIAAAVISIVPVVRAETQAELQQAVTVCNRFMLPILLLMIIPGAIAGLRLAMAEFVMADRPGMKIRASMKQSREMMKDQKRGLFLLMVSFLLWYLLQMFVSSFLSGMGSGVFALVFQMASGLAIQAYMSCSMAAFYQEIRFPEIPQTQEAVNDPAPEEAVSGETSAEAAE